LPLLKKEAEKPVSEKENTNYVRSEFLPGERQSRGRWTGSSVIATSAIGIFMMGSDKFSEKPVHYVNN
jgi:hypothetical protein